MPDVDVILLDPSAGWQCTLSSFGRWCKVPLPAKFRIALPGIGPTQPSRSVYSRIPFRFRTGRLPAPSWDISILSCALDPQPVVQGSLHIAVIAGKLGRKGLPPAPVHRACCSLPKQAQQHFQPPAKMIRMFQPLRLLCVENLSAKGRKHAVSIPRAGRNSNTRKREKGLLHHIWCSSPSVLIFILRSCQTSLFLLRRSRSGRPAAC